MVWNFRRKLCALLQGNEISERVEIIPCREFSESYLEPLKNLKEHPIAENSK